MKNKGVEEQQHGPVPRLRFPEFNSNAPWELRSLGEDGHFLPSLTGKSSSDFGVGSGSYIPYTNVFANAFIKPSDLRLVNIEANETQSKVRRGDVIFTTSSETPEEAGLSSIVLDDLADCYLNSFCTLFRYYPHRQPNLQFSGYLLRSSMIRDRLVERAQGSTRFNLSKKAFAELPVPYPCCLEQEKIAACLCSLDELIAAEGLKLSALKTHNKGLLQQLFPAEGETMPRLRFPEFRDAGEWQSIKLGKGFEISSGGTPDRSKKEYWNGSIPWVTTSLLKNGRITTAEEYISEEGLRSSSAKMFPRGTVLIAMYGQGKTRGKVSILDCDAATNQACAAILPSKKILPDFVFMDLGNRYEELRSLSNPGGQENLSQTLIKALELRYPVDLDEQKKVTACLSMLGEQASALLTRIELLTTHKKGLMQQLFPALDEVQA